MFQCLLVSYLHKQTHLPVYLVILGDPLITNTVAMFSDLHSEVHTGYLSDRSFQFSSYVLMDSVIVSSVCTVEVDAIGWGMSSTNYKRALSVRKVSKRTF